ncbi:MAG TPA: site-2 protease family protein, partial [Phycisphaerales bacterium]|nr:site-2 protease family protein [Phycisphaerales bacterium]
LGQEDANPGAVSDEPDSYQRASVGKRMIVISAGVVANLLLAAILFVVVYTLGYQTEPPRIGLVAPGSAAAHAVPRNGPEAGVARPGLQPGDTVVSIDGRPAESFKDITLASAMGRRGREVELTVERPGVAQPLRFAIVPRPDPATRLQMFGLGPAASATLARPDDEREFRERAQLLERLGLGGVQPGMRLVSINGRPVSGHADLVRAANQAPGTPLDLAFAGADGGLVTVVAHPEPELPLAPVLLRDGAVIPMSHLLGLTPVLSVRWLEETSGLRDELRPGDLFARLGEEAWPSVPSGIAQVRQRAGGTVSVAVARPDLRGDYRVIPIGPVVVSPEGRIGFGYLDGAGAPALLASWPRLPLVEGAAPSGAALEFAPGSRLVTVAGKPVADFGQLRERLRAATADAQRAGLAATVELELAPPPGAGAEVGAAAAPGEARARLAWEIPAAEVTQLHALGWEAPLPMELFEPEQIELRGKNPLDSVRLGLRETRRVLLTTYLTFARLFQGSVKVEHLKGPVGIAHIGTEVASRGMVWLLLFLAMVSVNLAVVNFLPVPITDGGLFLMLLYEGLTGRAVSVRVQNVITTAGLVLIVGLFLFVTVNDIGNLLK